MLNRTELVCSELQLNKNQMDKYESMILLDTLLFLAENDLEVAADERN